MALACCLVTTSCEWATEPKCDICISSAIVVGTVRNSGQPVAGATVTAEIAGRSCLGASGASLYGAAETSASGDYVARVGNMISPGDWCIIVRVTPANGSGLAASTDTVPALRLRSEWTGPAARDSVRVDFVLVPAP